MVNTKATLCQTMVKKSHIVMYPIVPNKMDYSEKAALALSLFK
jgi:hypothetical protein